MQIEGGSENIIPPCEAFPKGWQEFLKTEFQKQYFQKLTNHLYQEEKSGIDVYPLKEDIFRVFLKTEPKDIRVVILGQDPYHGAGQAMGLSFSVPKGVKIPPSLKNIFKEIQQDLNTTAYDNGDLSNWERQGVFLLNSALTVRATEAGSHSKIGWHKFSDNVIQHLGHHHEGIVFLLWGSHAHKKAILIDKERNLVLETSHPSPLSAYRGFLGCGHFSTANKWLVANGSEAINW